MSRSPALFVRSLLFNVLFYVNIIVRMIVALPIILLPRRFLLGDGACRQQQGTGQGTGKTDDGKARAEHSTLPTMSWSFP